ncbi:MAG TPA: twin-arginine translocase subunit TatC [Candidatus Limnocylindrales bacterium]|nr:twin-arginine translocase subunit TatC [Candidatus Limnocylindrales bacterium]
MATIERDKELSLVQHLKEFRDRLMVACIAIAITTAISFLFTTDIIKLLLLPSGVAKLVALSPTENFTTYFRVALFSGFALAMPVILYEIFAYIDPALHPHERKFALTLGPFILLLFVVGMLFCYLILLPSALKFLLNFGSEVIENQLRAAEYLSFVTLFIVGMGVVFEMPVLIYAVIKLGVVQRSWLTKRRRYVFLISFVAAAVLTPTPDPFNQSLVAIPIYLLFELGLLLARFGGGRRAAA